VSEVMQELGETDNRKSFKDIASKFIAVVVNQDVTTIDHIKEISDYGGHQFKSSAFAPMNILEDDHVREAFMMVESHLSKECDTCLVNQFDFE